MNIQTRLIALSGSTLLAAVAAFTPAGSAKAVVTGSSDHTRMVLAEVTASPETTTVLYAWGSATPRVGRTVHSAQAERHPSALRRSRVFRWPRNHGTFVRSSTMGTSDWIASSECLARRIIITRSVRFPTRAARILSMSDFRAVSSSYCVPEAAGSPFTKTTTAATTWTNGTHLGPVIGIDLSSKTGYSSESAVHFLFTANGRLCGTNGDPGATPGRLVALW